MRNLETLGWSFLAILCTTGCDVNVGAVELDADVQQVGDAPFTFVGDAPLAPADAGPQYAEGCVVSRAVPGGTQEDGRLVPVGASFFDGCNACTCGSDGTAGCNGAFCGTERGITYCMEGSGPVIAVGTTWADHARGDCRCSAVGDHLCDVLPEGACVYGERVVPNHHRFFGECDVARCDDGLVEEFAIECEGDTTPFCRDANDARKEVGDTWTEGDRDCRCSAIGDVLCELG